MLQANNLLVETVASDNPQAALLGDREFKRIGNFLREQTGVDLAPSKKALVVARLGKRLRHHQLDSFRDYVKLALDGDLTGERQILIDLLTTHETYFFREPAQLNYLRDKVLPGHPPSSSFRVWSAACSSGEEVYSLAMILDHQLGRGRWEVFGSDISTQVLEDCRRGHYQMSRSQGVPEGYLKKYCLRGVGPQSGTLLIDKSLRDGCSFSAVNLIEPLPTIGPFDAVFLRNVLIYFQTETTREIARRVASVLKPGGHLFVGHSESVKGHCRALENIAPATYRKVFD